MAKKEFDWKEYIGERVLLRMLYGDKLHEAVIEEVSPNGYVKFRWPATGHQTWEDPDEYVIVNKETL